MKNITNAIKNLGRRGQHNVVKILCLAVGLALGSVMIAEVWFEQNYDTWFKGHERTYRLYETYSNSIDKDGYTAYTPGAFAMGMRKYCPQVEAATRWRWLIGKTQILAPGDRRIMEHVQMADSCLFDVFPQKILAGDARKALSRPFYCVISRDMAERLGGVDAAVGMKLTPRDHPKLAVTVGAVYEDFPIGSVLRDEHIMVSMTTWRHFASFDSPGNWVGNDCFNSYVRLVKGAKPEDVQLGVKKMMQDNIDQKMLKEAGVELGVKLVEAKKMHTDDDYAKSMIMVLTILASILLFSMVMNYLLVLVGNVLTRSREMAVRKCYGAGNGNMLAITFSETLVHLVLAIALAALLVFVCKGSIEKIVNAPLEAVVFSRGAWILAAICIGILIVGGIVPAWLYSRVPVTSAFRGYHTTRRHWKLALLALQFAASAMLVAVLVVIQRQYTMMINADMGYDYERLVAVNVDGGQQDNNYSKCEEELARLGEVEMVSSCSTMPFEGAAGNNIFEPGNPRELFNVADLYSVGNGYIRLMNIKMVEGKGFTENSDSTMREMMVSRSFVERIDTILHLKGSIIGHKFFVSEHSENSNGLFTVCGVYEDVRIGNIIHNDTRPSVMFYNRTNNPGILVRLHRLDETSMDAVRRCVERICPGREVKVMAYPTLITDSYQEVDSLRKVVTVAGVVTFLIALVGLIGYTVDEVNRRRKEIAVRKVNGAKAKDILAIFVRSILYIAVPSLTIGAIAAWFISQQWLTAFSEKITLSPLIFIGSVAVLLVLVVAIVMANSYKIANSNPVKYLKDE